MYVLHKFQTNAETISVFCSKRTIFRCIESTRILKNLQNHTLCIYHVTWPLNLTISLISYLSGLVRNTKEANLFDS